MHLQFVKYQGTGNDFILIDNRQGTIELSGDQIIHLCDRNFGIGSDGLILIEPSENSDFYMNFYNPDASQSFCGNGSRCAVKFAHSLGLIEKQCRFHAIDGEHQGKMKDDLIHIKMRDLDGFEISANFYFLDTGSPHVVIYEEDIQQMNLIEKAHNIRYNKRFKEAGTNVNFAQTIDGNSVKMRTYERGVEAETLSCGTGVTAVALTHQLRNTGGTTVNVKTSGGLLQVSADYINNQFKNVWLIGPAEEVFNGTITL